jgi:hypothetical protein
MKGRIGKKMQKRIESFVCGLESMEHKERIEAIKDEIQHLKTVERKDGTNKKGYSINYINMLLGHYNELSESKGMKLKRYYTIGYKNKNKIVKSYRKKLKAQQSELKPIYNYKRMIKKAVSLLDSDSVNDVICSLCFLTGRRMAEVVKTAKFNSIKASKEKLNFSGQLKKRSEFGSYEVYTLGESAELCKKALKRLRAMIGKDKLKNMSINDVNRRFETSVTYKVNGLFYDYIGYATAHDLRRAYATICTHLYKPQNQTDNSFIASILGHNPDDLTSANSYQKYYIK